MCVEKVFLAMNVTDRLTYSEHNNIAKIIYTYGQTKDKRGKGK